MFLTVWIYFVIESDQKPTYINCLLHEIIIERKLSCHPLCRMKYLFREVGSFKRRFLFLMRAELFKEKKPQTIKQPCPKGLQCWSSAPGIPWECGFDWSICNWQKGFPTKFFNLFCLSYLVTLVRMEEAEHCEGLVQAVLYTLTKFYAKAELKSDSICRRCEIT